MDLNLVRKNFKNTYNVDLDLNVVYSMLKEVAAKKEDKWKYNVTKNYVTAEFRDIDIIVQFVKDYEDGLFTGQKNGTVSRVHEPSVKQPEPVQRANSKTGAAIKKRA